MAGLQMNICTTWFVNATQICDTDQSVCTKAYVVSIMSAGMLCFHVKLLLLNQIAFATYDAYNYYTSTILIDINRNLFLWFAGVH